MQTFHPQMNSRISAGNGCYIVFWVALFDLLSSMEIWHAQAATDSGRGTSLTHASLLASDAFWVRSWAHWDGAPHQLPRSSSEWNPWCDLALVGDSRAVLQDAESAIWFNLIPKSRSDDLVLSWRRDRLNIQTWYPPHKCEIRPPCPAEETTSRSCGCAEALPE